MGNVTGVKCKVHVCVYVLGPKYWWAYDFNVLRLKVQCFNMIFYAHQ